MRSKFLIQSNSIYKMDDTTKCESTQKSSFSIEIAEKIVLFRDLVQKEKNLVCPLDNEFLIRFLYAGDCRINVAINILKKYYEMRKKNQDIFQDLHPSKLIPVFKENIQIVLPNRDKNGRHIFLFNAGKWNPATVNLDEIFRSNYLLLEEMTSYTETQINGVTSIVDFKGFDLNQAKHFLLSAKHAQRMVQVLQGAFPARFKEFHLINQPSIFKMLYTVVKPLLSETIKNRIHFHGSNFDSLHAIIDPNNLPHSLGGNIDMDENMDDFLDDFTLKMIEKDAYYKGMLNYGYAGKK